jgi:hypothetical protein
MIHFKKQKLFGGLAALMAGGALLAPGIAPVAVAQEAETEQGAEALTRGPVHEAFAATVSFDPEPGIIIDREPPALIEEIPPEQQMEGDNVTWIPGYWGWDEEESDFLWISGIWRNLPPGREWVPGYWAPLDGRYQWTSGYWEDAENEEVTYLPEPPKSVEAGPSVEATSNDQTWVPGNWVYREDRYAWRAGYWVDARPNWVWTPAYYRYSPRGYVYVDGYWDYPVVRRGVVFAPVRVRREYYSRPDYYYTPSVVISLGVFTNHLFLRPRYHHYYYGDYYEPRYRDRGYYASYSYFSSRRGYDPIYAHSRWEHRDDRDWDRRRREYFEYRRDHEDARPPRTWAALRARSDDDRRREDFGVAERLDRVVDRRDEGRPRFKKIDKSERDTYVAKRDEIRKYRKERSELETASATRVAEGDKKSVKASKVKVNRSPVVARKSDKSDKDGGPPPRLQPRVSEKDASADMAKKGDRSTADRDDTTKEKKKQDSTANRDGEPRSTEKKPAGQETRTKPGERRDPETASKGKSRTDEQTDRGRDTAPEKKAKPTEAKRQTEPAPERKQKSQADPTPQKKVKPQADPSSQKKAKPQSDSAPQKKAKPQSAPTNEKKAKPQSAPTQERKAKKPQSEPNQQKKAKEKNETSYVPSRKVEKTAARQTANAPERKKTVKRSEPQEARRKMASAQPRQQASAPQKSKSSARTESVKKKDEEPAKKKKKTE